MFTFTGTLEDHGGNPLAGVQLLIQPTPASTVDTTGKVVRIGGSAVETDEFGTFSVDLATGDGLTYTVRSTAGGPVPPKRFEAPADGAVLDLADVTPIPAPSPLSPMVRGASAYDIAVTHGFDGTEAEWLASLHGQGAPTPTTGVVRITQDPTTEAYPPRPPVQHVEYVGWSEPTDALDFDTFVQMPTRPASDVIFTDFSAHPAGQTPPTWQPIYDTAGGQWVVRSGAGYGGGPALCHEGTDSSGQTIRGILWNAVPEDAARTQVEMVARFKVGHVSNNPLRLHMDASGSTGTSGDITGIQGGMLSSNQARISRYINGARTDYASAPTGVTVGPNMWLWTRMQIDGTTVRVRLWREEIAGVAQEEPDVWHATHTNAGFKAAGRVGLFGVGAMTAGATLQTVDRVGVGLHGQPAPKVTP